MKFSIIVPVYNAERYLRECLESVLAQTMQDWECICVDDGSTDGSGAILDEYAARDKRFRVIHKANEGVAVARNTGLEHARGEWITWLDADDEYAPWRLEEAARIIDKEDPDLIRFRTRFADERHGDKVELERKQEYTIFDGEAAKRWCWVVLLPGGMMWTFVARRDLFDANRFIPGIRVKEEFPVCARIATRVSKVVQSKAEAYLYRQLDSSAMHRKKTAQECIRFLDMVRATMGEMPFGEAQIGKETCEAMKERVRMHCECEIIDWVRMRVRDDNGQDDIYAAYHKLRETGVLNCRSIQQLRYLVPMWWWDTTGQIWPIKAMVIVERIIRSIKK